MNAAKRILLICICVGLAFAGTWTAKAEELTAETENEAADFLYEPNEEGGLTLTAYTASSPEPEIPREIDGQPVTAIGESCFAGLLCLERVYVPEGITRIEDYAFECCSALKKIYLPDSLRSIGEGAFSGCVRLVMADIQEGLETIGRGAFLTCTSLIYLDLPESLTEIGAFACSGCSSLASVVFHGDHMTELPDRVFNDCAKLASVSLPKDITFIGSRAFYGCESLNYLYAASPLTQISKEAFSECSALRNVDMSARVIGEEAFSGCRSLSYIRLDGTESIGYRAFMSSGVRDLSITESLTEIAEGAFANSKIGSVYTEDESHFKMIGTSLCSADGKTLIACFPEDPYAEEPEEEIAVPDGVETICGYAFTCVWGVSRVVLPDSVKSIHAHAFSLSTVCEAVIPEGTEVDPDAFLESAMETYEEDGYEETSVPEETEEAQVPENTGSIAGDRSLFRPEDFEGYLQISNDEFEEWSAKYRDYVSQYYPVDEELIPYIHLYKGEVIPHYIPMTYVQNHDPEMYENAVRLFGEGFEETYQVMNHGLFTELRRGKMCDDLVLYSGVYDSQLMAAAGTDEVPSLEQLADRIGSTFTDPCMISTTTDIRIACNFSDTLFIIYASREAMEDLGAVAIDSIVYSNEKEILMCENAQYRLLDVGIMAVESKDGEDQPLTLYRNYVTVELLGSGE